MCNRFSFSNVVSRRRQEWQHQANNTLWAAPHQKLVVAILFAIRVPSWVSSKVRLLCCRLLVCPRLASGGFVGRLARWLLTGWLLYTVYLRVRCGG